MPSKNTIALDLKLLFDYILKEKIDEIYCSLSELDAMDVKAITKFADNNLKLVVKI